MVADSIKLAGDHLIKPFEGYAKRLPDGSCTAYPDPGTGGDPWTIGWGSTGPGIVRGTVWTREQADAAFDKHVLYFANWALRLSPGLATEPAQRLAAIISFMYNCGVGAYRASRLRLRVNEGDWGGACAEIVKWNKAGGRVLRGLTRRRQAEAAFLGLTWR